MKLRIISSNVWLLLSVSIPGLLIATDATPAVPRLGAQAFALLFPEAAAELGLRRMDMYCSAAVGSDAVYVNNMGSLFKISYPVGPSPIPEYPPMIQIGEFDNPVAWVRYLDPILYGNKYYDGREETLGESFFESANGGVFEKSGVSADGVVEDRGYHYKSTGRVVNLFYRTPEGGWARIGEPQLNGGQGLGPVFHVDDGVVIWGGGGPIVGYIEVWRAELHEDGTSWRTEPYLLYSTYTAGPISDRDIFTIASNPASGTFFMGAQGAIYRSADRGESFDYALRYPKPPENGIGVAPDDAYLGPGVFQFLFPSMDHRQILAAGYDPGPRLAYLGWSTDDGKTWTNISDILGDFRTANSSTVFLFETPDGKIFAGVASAERMTLSLIEIELASVFGDDYFPTAEYVGKGYWDTEGLGFVYAAHHPWVWIDQQGVWCYLSGASDENLWLWDQDLGWLWTSRAITPYYYRASTGGYLYHQPYSRGPRWFFDFETDDWLTVP